MSKTEWLSAVPVLASLNIEESAEFYRKKLGFSVLAQYPNYLVIIRDGVVLHFWITDDPDIPKATSCYINVSNIGPLYEEFTAAEVIHPNGALEKKPHGMTEFSIADNHGNLIKFGERG